MFYFLSYIYISPLSIVLTAKISRQFYLIRCILVFGILARVSFSLYRIAWYEHHVHPKLFLQWGSISFAWPLQCLFLHPLNPFLVICTRHRTSSILGLLYQASTFSQTKSSVGMVAISCQPVPLLLYVTLDFDFADSCTYKPLEPSEIHLEQSQHGWGIHEVPCFSYIHYQGCIRWIVIFIFRVPCISCHQPALYCPGFFLPPSVQEEASSLLQSVPESH